MEKNIISYSNNINILNLLSNILSNYDILKENIIGFSFDDEDLLYILSLGYIYLDSNNELTKYKIDPEPPYEFEGYTKTENKEFNLRDYVETKFYDFKKILTSFNIKIDGELCYEFIPGDYVIDDMGDEVIIEKPVQKFYFKIFLNIQDLKSKMFEYLKNEIEKKKFHYSIEKIEKDILSKFDEFGKSEIIISNKSLGDKLNHSNNFQSKLTYNKDDLITIVYYNDTLQLFLYKLFLDGYLLKIEGNCIVGDIKRINDSLGKDYIIQLSTKITYNKTKKIITHNQISYQLTKKGANEVLLEILLDNVGSDFDSIEGIQDFYKNNVKSHSKKTISEQISDTFYSIPKKKSKYKFMSEVIEGKKIIQKI